MRGSLSRCLCVVVCALLAVMSDASDADVEIEAGRLQGRDPACARPARTFGAAEGSSVLLKFEDAATKRAASGSQLNLLYYRIGKCGRVAGKRLDTSRDVMT